MTLSPRKIPSPEPNAETKAFWDAARDGRLVLRNCTACGRTHYYPRTICPHCFSDQTEWRQASGMGVVYSYSVMRRAAEPYVIAYVTLDEGVTVLTNIVDCEPNEVRIGQKVSLIFKPSENGQAVPMFTPA